MSPLSPAKLEGGRARPVDGSSPSWRQSGCSGPLSCSLDARKGGSAFVLGSETRTSVGSPSGHLCGVRDGGACELFWAARMEAPLPTSLLYDEE